MTAVPPSGGENPGERPVPVTQKRADDGVRQTALYFLAVAIGQGLTFLILPLATRFLDAEAYGEYALATTVSSLVGMFGTAWIRNIGMRLYFDAINRGTTRGFYVATASLQAVVFTALYGATLLVMLGANYEFISLRVLASAGLTILLADQFGYAVALLRAEQRPVPYAIAEIASGVLRFAATSLGLLAGLVSASLLFDAASLGFALAGAYAITRLWPQLVGSARPDVGGLREVLATGPRSIPFSVSAWLERLADRLILQHYLGTATVGLYSVGYTLGERIVASLTQAVFMMAWPRILDAWNRGGPEAARHSIVRAQHLFAWLTIGPTGFLVVFGAPLTRWITGPEFYEAAEIVPLIAVALWLGGFGTYLNRHLELTKRFGTLSAISFAGAVVNVALNLVLIPRYGMVGAASATLANYAFNVLVFYATRDRAVSVVAMRPLVAAAGTAAGAYALGALLALSAVPHMTLYVAVYGGVALTRVLQERT